LASLRNDNFSLTLNSAFTNGEPALLAAPLDQATMAMNKLSVVRLSFIFLPSTRLFRPSF
jgi:hypothetical protein